MNAVVFLKRGPVLRQMTELEFSRAAYRDDSGDGPRVQRVSGKAVATWKANLASVESTAFRMGAR